MTHSYRSHYFHLVWSTKERSNWINKDMKDRLYAYIGGIVKEDNRSLLCVGGTANHVHLLVSMGNVDNFSVLIKKIKVNSSVWIRKNFPALHYFSWQEGYGSFSTSYSSINIITNYINNQEKHHSKMTFEEEYLQILQKHKLKFDERFVFG